MVLILWLWSLLCCNSRIQHDILNELTLILEVIVHYYFCLLWMSLSMHIWWLIKFSLSVWESSHLCLNSIHPLSWHHLILVCIGRRIRILRKRCTFGKAWYSIIVRFQNHIWMLWHLFLILNKLRIVKWISSDMTGRMWLL